MVENLLDYSVPLDINLTISDDLAEQVYEATDIGGYKKSRIPQLQVLLANIISNHKTDPDLYIAVSQDNSAYKPKSRYNSLSENGGDKLVHGSGGIFPAAGGIKPCHL